ncbi:cellobiose ABC transporter membrane protein [Kitasatospora sp. SolWspMP-SS2h]|uniref:carbohydrate ABC transporter permease n=1 Tax=Kitasatospora sp. SolWspMP-SS2h TaxID=1305729 RepID=UPI000DB99C6D|nr:carbohydrate ABC transporter permease [Kitasatospora sp. SolWspMP-SS2h]RAJ32074.1 cellobiose ABC transporter membrane protein [Kitasatospora sp. SolWspMP-SS2h]
MTHVLDQPAAPAPARPLVRKARSPLKGGPLAYAVLIGATLLAVFPFYWTLVAASRSNSELGSTTPALTPGPNLFHNIGEALQQAEIGKALLNSLIVSGVVTAGVVLSSTLAGFAFAKLRFRGRGALLALTVGTMMIPPQLGVIPLFMVIVKLDLQNKLPSVILPSLVSAFGVFFMRQYLVQALPDELVEAGRMDGASLLRIFRSIVLPVARPGMAVLGMLTFMATWNDFFWPIVALSSQNPTVQVALKSLGQGYVPDQSVVMAGTLIGTLPVLVVFALLGRQIVGGIMQGAVKG